jgi:hypothetical protein
MNSVDGGFEVVIVCCSTEQQAKYWQKRLEGGRGSVISKQSIVLAVHEDWPGGAGNALGTLYAFQNAARTAKERHGIDIEAQLRAGEVSIGLYHTAGKGTRLAPLPGAENNNKPGVKLPANVTIGGSIVPITILEAVIKQTGCYARSRRGRLSVFWGDQIFIPAVSVEYKPSFHVDLLCLLGPMPTAEEWKAKGNQNYGMVALSTSNKAAQVEKVDHATATQMLAGLGEIKSVGSSLGSFSVSSSMLFTLLSEFASELAQRRGKFDSDPHLWMPMTLQLADYKTLMAQKGMSAADAESHHKRIEVMMSKFNADRTNSSLGTFGPVDVGQDICWWDYGLLRLYQKNVMMMSERSPEADLMRSFFGLNDAVVTDSTIIHTAVDSTSLICSSEIGNDGKSIGSVRNSVLCNVRCSHIDVEGCILVNVTAQSIYARPGCIIYNVFDEGAVLKSVNAGEVFAGVVSSDETQLIMRSAQHLGIYIFSLMYHIHIFLLLLFNV